MTTATRKAHRKRSQLGPAHLVHTDRTEFGRSYSPPDRELRELVARAQSGEEAALEAFYRRYCALVYRLAFHYCRNQATAEDLTSKVFIKALRGLPGFKCDKDPAAWLSTILRNTWLDHLKSHPIKLEVTDVPLRDEDQFVNGLRPYQPDQVALERLTRVDLRRRIDLAMKALNPRQREVIHLRFLEGLCLADAAIKMGMEVSALKTLQYRAVQALKRNLITSGFVQDVDAI